MRQAYTEPGSWATVFPRSGTGPFSASFESLSAYRCPDWFGDAKFGIWGHWGPQSVPTNGDRYARTMYLYHLRHYGHRSRVGYKDACRMWRAAAEKVGRPFGLTEHLGARFSWWSVSKGADTWGLYAGVLYDGNDPAYRDFYLNNEEHVRKDLSDRHGEGESRALAEGFREEKVAWSTGDFRFTAKGGTVCAVVKSLSRESGKGVSVRLLGAGVCPFPQALTY